MPVDARGWWRRRSLRVRLTAASTTLLAAALAVTGLLLVWRQHAALLAGIEATARTQAQDVALAIDHGQLTTPLRPPPGGGVEQVVGPAGQVIASTADLDGNPRLFDARGGADVTFTTRTVDAVDERGSYRVAATGAGSPGHRVTVYVAIPLRQADTSVAELELGLAVGLPILLLLLAGVGWLLVGRALRPVEVVRRQVAAITGTDLHARLDASPGNDELRRLVDTFNDLLVRLDSLTGRQRQFIADAAHELRSPLAALRAQIDVAHAHGGPVTEAMAADATRLSRLVDNLLQLARLDARPALRRAAVDLDDIVFEQAARVPLPAYLTLDTNHVGAARVEGDAQALSRVLTNLLDNAVRHARHRVGVSLTSETAGGTDATCHLVVTDDGPGIPIADRRRVFERFTRLDDARSRDTGGSGLGLAIVHDLVAAHQGSVLVEDEGPGARFIVELPLAPRGQPPCLPPP